MYSRFVKNIYAGSVVITMTLILCLGILTASDIHADGKFHSDCPLCQLKLNNIAPDIHIDSCTAIGIPLFSVTICTEDVIISKKIIFNSYLPHAPPDCSFN